MKMVTVSENGVSSAFGVCEFGSGSPCIAFTAGIHGNEINGIHTAHRLIEFFEQNPPINGRVKIVPTANPTAMRAMQRRCPFDEVDLNRIFPGSPDGSISMRIADALWKETEDADYIVDLHCYGGGGLTYLLSIYGESEKAHKLMELITLPVSIHSEGTGGQLFTESCRKRGQAAVIIELPLSHPEGAICEQTVGKCISALMDMLCALGFVQGSVRGTPPVLCKSLLDMDMPHGGLWEPCVKNGDEISHGDIIGKASGEDVRASDSGIAIAVRKAAYTFEDNLWAVMYANKNIN